MPTYVYETIPQTDREKPEHFEIKQRIPEKKRSCELRELLTELEAEPSGPPEVDPYALLDDVQAMPP